ncbi:hypothetical protein Micbo1qcDRAFT_158433, partial [Microdochium bolleyi]
MADSLWIDDAMLEPALTDSETLDDDDDRNDRMDMLWYASPSDAVRMAGLETTASRPDTAVQRSTTDGDAGPTPSYSATMATATSMIVQISDADNLSMPERPPLTLPTDIEDSVDALKYIGFTPRRAAELWAGWNTVLRRSPTSTSAPSSSASISNISRTSFISWVLSQLSDFGGDERFQYEDEWKAYMRAEGLSADFQERVWEPFFACFRQHYSCKEYVVYTIKSRYEELQ